MHRRRRRRKNAEAAENNSPWQSLNLNPQQRSAEHHRESPSNSGINQPENLFINTQEFFKNKQLRENPPSSSRSAMSRKETHRPLTSNRRSSTDSPSPTNLTEVHLPPKPFKARQNHPCVLVTRIKRSTSANSHWNNN